MKRTQVAIIPSLSSYVPLKTSCGKSRPVEGVPDAVAVSLRLSVKEIDRAVLARRVLEHVV